jgi:hypothetical protein
MLRHVAYACLVVAFSVFAYFGLQSWAHGPRIADGGGATDETPLKAGALLSTHWAAMGYPWPERRDDVVRMLRDLPPDPADPTAEDERKANEVALLEFQYPMPSGRLTWPEIFDHLKKTIEPIGVPVTTGDGSPHNPAIPATFAMDIESKKGNANAFLFQLHEGSREVIQYAVTSEGLAVGADEACNHAVEDARLIELRRRVEPEHADHKLDAEYRPDLMDASINAFARTVEAQTGVALVADPRLWEVGTALKWRGEPRKLRDVLDAVSTKLRAYWRYREGRVWLLKP